MAMRVLSAIGARPQFVKAAPVSAVLRREGLDEIIVHSGQHYDDQLSRVFFEELGLREPDLNLGIGSGPHGKQTGAMLTAFEKAIERYSPQWVLVHGDTNTTLAAALAAVKLEVSVCHNEAGLRSFNRSMPEEHNRVLTDHCSDLLACPTRVAARQLGREGITRGVHVIGDVMCDAARIFGSHAGDSSDILDRLGLSRDGFVLATLHRPYNVDLRHRLSSILTGLGTTDLPVVVPEHPRLRRQLAQQAQSVPSNLRLIPPVGYLDMVTLERAARHIATDSGGVQKEAYLHGTPCVTLRPETEWVETVETGWNVLVDADPVRIEAALNDHAPSGTRPNLFGDGHAADKLVKLLQSVSVVSE